MAHTYDTKAQFTTGATDPREFAYTCGAGTTLLTLLIVAAGLTQRTGGAPTYNGVAFTLGDKQIATAETNVEFWYMLNPPTGASYTIQIQNDNTLTIFGCAASFKAASGYTSALRTCSKTTGSTANPGGPTMTSLAAGDVIVSILGTGDNAFAPTAQTGTVIYTYDPAAYGMGSQYYITPDTANRSLTWTEATAAAWATVCASFKEVEAKSGSSSVSGGGSQVATGAKGGKGSATIGAAGALVALGFAAMLGLASTSGGGSIAATGQKAASGVSSISGGGEIVAVGEVGGGEEHSGAASISGGGSLASAGSKGGAGPGTISGNGSIVATGSKGGQAIAAISGGGILTGAGSKQGAGLASISGGGSLAALGEKGGEGTGIISAGGVLTATGTSSISGGGAIEAYGVKGHWITDTTIPIPVKLTFIAEGRKRTAVSSGKRVFDAEDSKRTASASGKRTFDINRRRS